MTFSCTAMRKLERLGIQTSSSFYQNFTDICEFKANILHFWCLHGLVFDLETIGVS